MQACRHAELQWNHTTTLERYKNPKTPLYRHLLSNILYCTTQFTLIIYTVFCSAGLISPCPSSFVLDIMSTTTCTVQFLHHYKYVMSSIADKEERKREVCDYHNRIKARYITISQYNRLAQREFRKSHQLFILRTAWLMALPRPQEKGTP